MVVIILMSFGVGVLILVWGEVYYYGGFYNNGFVLGWIGLLCVFNRLIKYDMDSNVWSNVIGFDDVRRVEGEMVFFFVGDVGMFVYFGGS